MEFKRPHILVPTLVAAVVRLAHFQFLAIRDPLFRKPVVDAWFHTHQARSILESGWLLPGSGAYYKGPLYSYVLAVLFSIFGEDAGIVAARLLSITLGCTSVALVAKIGDRLGGAPTAWGAGITAAFYGTSVHFDTTVLLVPLVTAGLLLAAERMLAACSSSEPKDTLKNLAIAGAALGAVSITRANGLLAVIAGIAWAAIELRRGRWPHLRALQVTLALGLPALVVIAPVTFRNAILERDPVVVSWNGGINLFMGNDPGFDQASGNWHPDLAWMRLYGAPESMGLTRGADHQKFFLGQTVRRAIAHPATQIRLLSQKTALTFLPYEIQNNRRIDPLRKFSPVLALLLARYGRVALPLAVIGPLVAAGLVLAGRQRLTSALAPIVLSVAWLVTPILFFQTARFRLPGILLLLPVAAAGWMAATTLTLPRLKRRLALACGAALSVVALGLVFHPVNPALPPSDTANLAEVEEREGRAGEAMSLWRLAVEEEPDDPLVRIRLADRLRKTGDYAAAIGHYEAVLALPDLSADWYSAARRSLARTYVSARDYEAAVVWYREFLAATPDFPMTGDRPEFHLRGVPPIQSCTIRIELADALARSDRREEAVAELTRTITDCEPSESLAGKAQEKLRALAIEAHSGR